MEPIKWRDKLSIDNGVIDDDHRHLIEIINKFHFRATEVTFSSVEGISKNTHPIDWSDRIMISRR